MRPQHRTETSQQRLIRSYRYAVQLTRSSKSSFHLAMRMLPPAPYEAMCALYAFMRLTDDLADGPESFVQPSANSSTTFSSSVSPGSTSVESTTVDFVSGQSATGQSTTGESISEEFVVAEFVGAEVAAVTPREDAPDISIRRERLRQWREYWQSALAGPSGQHNGTAEHPLFPALYDVVQSFQLDPQWLDDVITGVDWDLSAATVQTEEDLLRYCYHVAGTVGLCCQAIWRADLTQACSLAIACGEAFQLTNILRDLGEDAERGRCYLPETELQQFGYSSSDLLKKMDNTAFRQVMAFQIQRATERYKIASQLDGHLQGSGQRMFRVMFSTYRQLLRQISETPSAPLQRRLRLSRWQKLNLLLTAPFCSVADQTAP